MADRKEVIVHASDFPRRWPAHPTRQRGRPRCAPRFPGRPVRSPPHRSLARRRGGRRHDEGARARPRSSPTPGASDSTAHGHRSDGAERCRLRRHELSRSPLSIVSRTRTAANHPSPRSIFLVRAILRQRSLGDDRRMSTPPQGSRLFRQLLSHDEDVSSRHAAARTCQRPRRHHLERRVVTARGRSRSRHIAGVENATPRRNGDLLTHQVRLSRIRPGASALCVRKSKTTLVAFCNSASTCNSTP